MTDTPTRETILENAISHTCGDREVQYGDPTKNLEDCAELWRVYLSRKYLSAGKFFNVTPEDVAWLNVLQKIARTFNGSSKLDTYEDAAAYAAIAGECATRNAT